MSLRAKFVIWHLKRTVKPKPMHLIDASVLRENMDAYVPKKTPRDITIEAIEENGVCGEWHKVDNADPERTILYLHGGGYVFGSAKSHRALTFEMARASRTKIFSLDYRLAPEHPFPAAVDDAIAAYRWLLDKGRDPAKMMISGDSAGGGLALALTYAIKARGLPMPACLALYSPWTDLAVTGASVDENDLTDAMFRAEFIRGGVGRVLNSADPKAPLASPLYADVEGFPPTLFYASDDEVLLDDSTRMHERLREAGVPSTLVRHKGLPHVWPVFVATIPEARVTIAETADFFREHIKEE